MLTKGMHRVIFKSAQKEIFVKKMCEFKHCFLSVIMGVLLLQTFALSSASAEMITLDSSHMGYYWYEKSSWLGGSWTDTGFSYGDNNGTQYVHKNYQYYGGADRYWQQKDLYFQIDLSSINYDLEQAAFNFYVTAYNSPAPSVLRHVDIQTIAATGNAAQKLAGSTDVAGTGSFVLGWNSLDVTSYIQSDLDKGYTFAAFSIPQFGQVQDENRLMSMYGPTSTTLVEGLSTQPYLVATRTPEPATLGLLAIGGLAVLRRRSR